ncbi:MAG: hypothetical protein EBQ57_07705 [Actinobacteria bacterium]|nr:hypothetical protein [Actinomycetota bacterium]
MQFDGVSVDAIGGGEIGVASRGRAVGERASVSTSRTISATAVSVMKAGSTHTPSARIANAARRVRE